MLEWLEPLAPLAILVLKVISVRRVMMVKKVFLVILDQWVQPVSRVIGDLVVQWVPREPLELPE